MSYIKEYLNNNYGECEQTSLGRTCSCVKNGWLGLACYSWRPFNISTYEELAEIQRQIYK
jgi:hypothetical protein